MTKKEQTDSRSVQGCWRSLGQLCELWGLSRARTRLVVDALVRSGPMEVRQLDEPADHRRLYRTIL